LNPIERENENATKRSFKLRLDLLEHVTPEDILEEALANVSRYKPEPSLSKTGVGYLCPATLEEREAEMKRSEALINRVEARAAAAKRARRRKKA